MTEQPPLETRDPARARALKAKIRDRVSDVRRHVLALRAAVAAFGEDFDLAAFSAAYTSDDPVELNHVKVVERGVDQPYNYIAELTVFGLELADLRDREAETNARRVHTALHRREPPARVITRPAGVPAALHRRSLGR